MFVLIVSAPQLNFSILYAPADSFHRHPGAPFSRLSAPPEFKDKSDGIRGAWSGPELRAGLEYLAIGVCHIDTMFFARPLKMLTAFLLYAKPVNPLNGIPSEGKTAVRT
jgi:hypothetical protein